MLNGDVYFPSFTCANNEKFPSIRHEKSYFIPLEENVSTCSMMTPCISPVSLVQKTRNSPEYDTKEMSCVLSRKNCPYLLIPETFSILVETMSHDTRMARVPLEIFFARMCQWQESCYCHIQRKGVCTRKLLASLCSDESHALG